MLICWKIQVCTHNQSWDMDILKYNKYCILSSTALIHVKMKFLKTTLKSLYMIDYLLFNHSKWNVNLLKNSIMYTLPKLRCEHFKIPQVLYFVFYNSNTCKNQNW